MKRIAAVTCLTILTAMLPAAHVHPLPEVDFPHSMCVDGNNLFVTGKSRIWRYRLPNQLVREFGKKGEGPGEFMEFTDMGLEVYSIKNQIAVASNGRLSWFSDNAEFVREIRTGGGLHFCPVNDHYVAIRIKTQAGRMVNVVTLFDRELQEVKALARKPYWFIPGEKIDPVNVRNPRFCVMNNRIYAEDHASGSIHIYDPAGNMLGSALAEYPRVAITPRDRQGYHEYYRSHKYYRDKYQQLKHLIQFPEYYPPVKFFDCADGHIYVFSHVRKNGANQLYVFDGTGKFQCRLMISMHDINPQELLPLIRVANNRIYQIFEDHDNEAWTLEVTEIPVLASK